MFLLYYRGTRLVAPHVRENSPLNLFLLIHERAALTVRTTQYPTLASPRNYPTYNQGETVLGNPRG